LARALHRFSCNKQTGAMDGAPTETATMYKITLTAGVEWTKVHTHVVDLDTKLIAIRQHIAATFGGFTETATFGGWIGPRNELVMERGRQWTILTDAMNNLPSAQLIARQLAELVALVLNQEAVVCEVAEVRAEFVGQSANDNAERAA
jgi:hypothetical protein